MSFDRFPQTITHFGMTDSENVLQLVDIIGDILTYTSYLYALAVKRKNQLYFNLVLIYTDNKVKSKEGKRRNGLRHNFSFYQQYQLVIRPLFLFSRREYTISIHLVDNSWDNTQKKNRSSVLRRGAILDSWW